MANRKALDAKIEQSAELYSSTIVKGVTKIYPNLDPTFTEIVKELSKSGFIDGAAMILDALERINSKEE